MQVLVATSHAVRPYAESAFVFCHWKYDREGHAVRGLKMRECFLARTLANFIAHRPEQLARPCRAEPRGAVDPAGGQLVSLFVTHNDTEFFQFFLGTMAAEVPAQAGKRPCWFWITRTGTSRNRSKGTISRSSS
jgi:hypothetical protein